MDELLPLVAALGDRIVQAHYVQRLARLAQVREGELQQMLLRQSTKRRPAVVAPRGEGRVEGEGEEEAGEGGDALAAHGVPLVGHGRGADLPGEERLLHLPHVLQQAQVPQPPGRKEPAKK